MEQHHAAWQASAGKEAWEVAQGKEWWEQAFANCLAADVGLAVHNTVDSLRSHVRRSVAPKPEALAEPGA